MRKFAAIIFTTLTGFFLLSGAHALAGTCQKTIQLYNQAAGEKGLVERERLLTRAIATKCANGKIMAKILNNLADTYERQGLFKRAIAGYHKASKADPFLATPYLSLGDIYAKLKRPKEADRYYEKGFLTSNFKSSKQIVESLSPGRAIRMQPKATLYFGFDQTGLSDEALRQLEALHSALKGRELLPYRFRLEGHTCSLGTEKYNQGLSERRSGAVERWLVAHDISEDRLMAVGFGEDRPVADNSSEEGRRRNRRVKIRTVGIVDVARSRSARGPAQQEARRLLKEGEQFLAEERYKEAIGQFKKALKAFDRENFVEGIKAALADLTLAYRFLGDWEKAEYYRKRGQ